jgi:MFS family permease
MLLGATVFGLCLVGFSLAAQPPPDGGPSHWFAICVVLMAVSGLCNVTYGTQANTILQSHTPSAFRGRVMGIYFLSRGLVPLGSLLAGAIATAIGAPHTVAIMGGACAIMALWILISQPEMRRIS